MANGASCRAFFAFAALVAATSPAPTQDRSKLSAISVLEPGRWELREIGATSGKSSAICVTDPRILTQVQHRDSPCSRIVISNEGRRTTVHYTCPAGDFGRTSIRVDNPRLAVIDTQGIDRGMPFEYRLEARRAGSCGGRR